MVAIDAVMSATKEAARGGGAQQHERGSSDDNETNAAAALAAANQARQEMERSLFSLAEEHATLKSNHEESEAERDSLRRELEQMREERSREQTSGVDVVLKEEVDSLRSQLRKSENSLAEAEQRIERLDALNKEQGKKVSQPLPPVSHVSLGPAHLPPPHSRSHARPHSCTTCNP